MQRWLNGERWLRRIGLVLVVLVVLFATCFGALWWRLGAGPINLDLATPWLAAAIEENIGHGNTVEVGGTQIERAGRVRVAVGSETSSFATATMRSWRVRRRPRCGCRAPRC